MWQVWIPSQRSVMAGVALLAGLVAAWAVQQHIQAHIAQIEAASHKPSVLRVVAAHDLVAGTRLEADDVAVREIPYEWANHDTLTPEDFIPHIGSVLAYAVHQGDPILTPYMTKHKPTSLSERVPMGRRAVTIPVDDVNTLAGRLQTGDFLDLYVSFEYQRRQVTVPLLQSVRVLATGHEGGEEEGGSSFSTITLDASLEDAVKLVAARQVGALTTMLRHHHDSDTAAVATDGDLASLLGMVPPPSEEAQGVPVLYGDQITDPRHITRLQEEERP